MDDHYQMGDRVERSDTGRHGTVVDGGSLFVVLVQWDSNCGEEEWIPYSLLREERINVQAR